MIVQATLLMYLAVLAFGVVDYVYANPFRSKTGNVVRLNVGFKFVTKLVRATLSPTTTR